MDRLGLIGGTGLVAVEGEDSSLAQFGFALESSEHILCETPYGEVPLHIQKFTIDGVSKTLIFLQRHHSTEGPTCPPHSIDHHANIWAMKHSNLDALVSVCSVGAIHNTFPPGKIAVADDYIDFTGVATTFHDASAQFTSMTTPFDENLNIQLQNHLKTVQKFGEAERMNYTYWLAQGPQFETPAEIDAIEKLGGDVVGMTMPREAKLSAEVGVKYAAILISSNWGAGRMPGDAKAQLHHDEVSKEANKHLHTIWSSIAMLMKN
jgi:5'-methylthioadenosine phosphorylase